MAERVGFEPTVQLPAHMISSHASSTNSCISPKILSSTGFLAIAVAKNLFRAVQKYVPIIDDWKNRWSRRDLNPWPHPCEGCALPTEPLPQKAERVGFEPTVTITPQQFSRLSCSTGLQHLSKKFRFADLGKKILTNGYSLLLEPPV